MKEPLTLGLDIGGTKVLAGVVTREGEIVRQELVPTPGDPDSLLAALDELIERLRGPEVRAVGIGVPGTIDQRRGRTVQTGNTPVGHIALRSRMEERHGLPVVLENDANCASVAEWTVGAGRGHRHLVMLTLGTGVGGGVIVDGRLLRGAVGAAAELGHVVVDLDGPHCQGDCTGRGHLEGFVSGRAADRAAAALWGEGATGHDLVTRAREGDAAALAALTEIGRILGIGIGSLVNVFDPEVVIVGGGFGTAAGELLLEPAREALRREALPPGRDEARILATRVGYEAGVVGAGLVAYERVDE